MREPNPVTAAAQVSGEPEFREVGVGPWDQTHPCEPRPDDPQSPNFDECFDPELLDEGDRRNVLDKYRYWSVPAIKADLDSRGRHGFEVAVENWTHDFNIGSMVRTANAFAARSVHIVGPHKWNRKGALMTELYQHVDHHPSIEELVTSWRQGVADELTQAEKRLSVMNSVVGTDTSTSKSLSERELHTAAGLEGAECDGTERASVGRDSAGRAGTERDSVGRAGVVRAGVGRDGTERDSAGRAGVGRDGTERAGAERDGMECGGARCGGIDSDIAERQQLEAVVAELEAARIIALDIVPGAVPIETYRFPNRCLMLFGAEGPGLSKKALELADDVVYISQFGSVRSINAGAAAAVAMHCWVAQHMGKA